MHKLASGEHDERAKRLSRTNVIVAHSQLEHQPVVLAFERFETFEQ